MTAMLWTKKKQEQQKRTCRGKKGSTPIAMLWKGDTEVKRLNNYNNALKKEARPRGGKRYRGKKGLTMTAML